MNSDNAAVVGTALRIARRTVEQWDQHDRLRMTDDDRLLFEGEIEPPGVTMARAVVAMATEFNWPEETGRETETG